MKRAIVIACAVVACAPTPRSKSVASTTMTSTTATTTSSTTATTTSKEQLDDPSTLKLEAMRGPFASLDDACADFAKELVCTAPCACVPALASLVLGSSLVAAGLVETKGSTVANSAGALRIGGAWFVAATWKRSTTRVMRATAIPAFGATRWAQIDLEQATSVAPLALERRSLVCARRGDRAACVALTASADSPERTTASITTGGALVVPDGFDAPRPGKYALSWPP
jgi:hypothetical protein